MGRSGMRNTLKTLIDKNVKSKPQKHGNDNDYIPQQKLVDKLRKEGLQGCFLDVLISMYSNNKSAVKTDDKLGQSCTCKEKDACCHLLFLISIGRTTHVNRDMYFPGRGKRITMHMCCAGRGTHITRNMCCEGWEHISLGICVFQVKEHKSLGICVSEVREHITLEI